MSQPAQLGAPPPAARQLADCEVEIAGLKSLVAELRQIAADNPPEAVAALIGAAIARAGL